MSRQGLRLTVFAMAFLVMGLAASSAQAQWVRRYYVPPVFVGPRPVTRVYRTPAFYVPPPAVRFSRGPTVVYQPSTVIYSRGPFGRTVVRSAPGYRRTVIW